MARKTLGYIELIWVCDSCGTQNPGAIKSCTSCGAPQPVNVSFLKVDAQTFNFVKDQALIRMAKAGPDKHCPYCGTRNPAAAEVCVQCGADLTVDATSRPAGGLVGTEAAPAASTESSLPAGRKPLPKPALILIIVIALAACATLAWLASGLFSSSEVSARVSSVSWERQIAVEVWGPVEASDWAVELPAEAEIISCSSEYHYSSQNFEPNATEVCGTPYTVDTGTGLGEVVQDCTYQVYDDYCRYTINSWTVADSLVASGSDLQPYWPEANLSAQERLGQQTEQYLIRFSADDQTYTYRTSDLNLFRQAQPGSIWTITVNDFGAVSSAAPRE